jgi:hypothetical protein
MWWGTKSAAQYKIIITKGLNNYMILFKENIIGCFIEYLSINISNL